MSRLTASWYSSAETVGPSGASFWPRYRSILWICAQAKSCEPRNSTSTMFGAGPVAQRSGCLACTRRIWFASSRRSPSSLTLSRSRVTHGQKREEPCFTQATVSGPMACACELAAIPGAGGGAPLLFGGAPLLFGSIRQQSCGKQCASYLTC